PGLPAKVLDQNAEDLTAVVDHLVATAVIDHAGIGTTDVDAVAGALPTLREPVDLVPRVGRAGTVCAARIIGSPRRRRDGLGPTGTTAQAATTCSTRGQRVPGGPAIPGHSGRRGPARCTARCCTTSCGGSRAGRVTARPSTARRRRSTTSAAIPGTAGTRRRG